jgi:hypothetical protein
MLRIMPLDLQSGAFRLRGRRIGAPPPPDVGEPRGGG